MGLIDELNERIDNKVPTVVAKAIQPTFLWETAIGYLTHCADAQAARLPERNRFQLWASGKRRVSS